MNEKIKREEIWDILEKYNHDEITVGTLGGHSGLDVARGAKNYGFKTIAVCQRGREKTYATHYRTNGEKGCIDQVMILDHFADAVKPEIVKKLQDLNTVFVHSRYFWVYFNFEDIETKFRVPVFGNRVLVKAEERNLHPNQYDFLDKAGIRTPRRFSDPGDIDRLVLVKAPEAERGYERAFFFASSYEDFKKKSEDMVKKGVVRRGAIQEAIIEEYVVGAQVNFNFFYSPLDKSLELLGTDIRRQTNLDGLLRLPAPEQLEILKYTQPKYIETGHIAVTVKESLLEKAFDAGEKFVKILEREAPPGMIGPFALQGAVLAGPPREEFVVFDVSMRIPGSPGIRYTPYTNYLWGESMSYGDRIGLELRRAKTQGRLKELVT
jgi:5-formaminoimidazole-4-carboxamide-1-(beta)-D-ribofuranosyl 5'-monophosphate synthetase